MEEFGGRGVELGGGGVELGGRGVELGERGVELGGRGVKLRGGRVRGIGRNGYGIGRTFFIVFEKHRKKGTFFTLFFAEFSHQIQSSTVSTSSADASRFKKKTSCPIKKEIREKKFLLFFIEQIVILSRSLSLSFFLSFSLSLFLSIYLFLSITRMDQHVGNLVFWNRFINLDGRVPLSPATARNLCKLVGSQPNMTDLQLRLASWQPSLVDGLPKVAQTRSTKHLGWPH
jgi:hypothetical protein